MATQDVEWIVDRPCQGRNKLYVPFQTVLFDRDITSGCVSCRENETKLSIDSFSSSSNNQEPLINSFIFCCPYLLGVTVSSCGSYSSCISISSTQCLFFDSLNISSHPDVLHTDWPHRWWQTWWSSESWWLRLWWLPFTGAKWTCHNKDYAFVACSMGIKPVFSAFGKGYNNGL